MSSVVTIARRLRPLRLAFLVPLKDRAALARTIEINTCIWGGRYNAIIPYQRSGIRYGRKRIPCSKVVSGYLARFEPDFLIDLTGEGKRFFDPDRVLEEREVFDRDKHGHVEHGVSINAILRHWYHKDFRFVRRHPEEFVLPTWNDSDIDLLLGAAFGQFPRALAHFARDYRDVFEPNEEPVVPANLYKKLRVGTPIKATAARLDVRRPGPHDVAAFILDGARASDVIDFWNLRAVGWRLFPFPVQWGTDLVTSARQLLEEQAEWFRKQSMLPPISIVAAREVSSPIFGERARP